MTKVSPVCFSLINFTTMLVLIMCLPHVGNTIATGLGNEGFYCLVSYHRSPPAQLVFLSFFSLVFTNVYQIKFLSQIILVVYV